MAIRKRESIDGTFACHIAERVWMMRKRFADPREAVRIGRLLKPREDVDKLLNVIARYS